MAQAGQDGKRKRLERFALIKLMFGLFPVLVAGGFLAPGWVEWMAVAQVGEESAREPVIDRIGPYGRRPLLVPRDFSTGFVPELLDLDQLFLGSRDRRAPADVQVARVDAFERTFGDLIAFDDFGQKHPQVDFKDILMDLKDFVVAAARDDDFTLPLCGTLYAGNCVRDDDFTGEFVIDEDDTQPVPEPDTAALLALGLLGLAWQGRRVRAGR